MKRCVGSMPFAIQDEASAIARAIFSKDCMSPPKDALFELLLQMSRPKTCIHRGSKRSF